MVFAYGFAKVAGLSMIFMSITALIKLKSWLLNYWFFYNLVRNCNYFYNIIYFLNPKKEQKIEIKKKLYKIENIFNSLNTLDQVIYFIYCLLGFFYIF
jgi:hypothetical protein